MKRVFITRALPEVGLAALRGDEFDVEVYRGSGPILREELLTKAKGRDGLITLVSEKVDDELLDAAGPSLKIVANYAVGYDNIDLPACTRRGVAVSNTPDVLTEATADLTWALLLAVARRLPEGEALLPRWTGWKPEELLGLDITGKTLGLVGLGRIGKAAARRALGFGMCLIYHNRTPDPEAKSLNARYVSLEELLQSSDFVSLHTPLTSETHHLIDEAALRSMKKTAVLVNTARGPVVDERALVWALREGWIYGAGLDVFELEPKLTPGLLELPNVALAPHLGSATRGAREAMARLCAESIVSVLSGKRPAHLLNPEVPL
jgi:glyoxylate reductase